MRLRAALLDLALPPACAGCDREGTPLCATCQQPLRRRLGDPPGVALGLPSATPLPIVQLEWCATYSGPIRAALHELKYGGERRLIEPLGEGLAGRWLRSGMRGDLIVAAPVHADRLRQRGYDQSVLLAQALSTRLAVTHARALERVRATTPQFELGRGARHRNVAGAFSVKRGFERVVTGRWIVLVDDVVTTGSTLAACAEALYRKGAVAVSALTVARER